MTESMVAACGLVCSDCPAYIACQTDDAELSKRTAAAWGSDDSPVLADDVNCDGCTTAHGVRWAWCEQCAVRTCASNRGVKNCAVCPDYGCSILEAFLEMAGEEARKRLATLRPTSLNKHSS